MWELMIETYRTCFAVFLSLSLYLSGFDCERSESCGKDVSAWGQWHLVDLHCTLRLFSDIFDKEGTRNVKYLCGFTGQGLYFVF